MNKAISTQQSSAQPEKRQSLFQRLALRIFGGVPCIYCGWPVRHYIGMDRWHRDCRERHNRGDQVKTMGFWKNLRRSFAGLDPAESHKQRHENIPPCICAECGFKGNIHQIAAHKCKKNDHGGKL